MRALCSFLLLLFTVKATTGQAPGDEDDVCLRDIVNEEVLMSSLRYRNLLPSNVSPEAPWSVVNNDTNNDNEPFASVTTVSKIRFEYFLHFEYFLMFYFSGQKQRQPVQGLLVCVDLKRVHSKIC